MGWRRIFRGFHAKWMAEMRGVVVTQSSITSAVYNDKFAALYGNREEEVAGMGVRSTLLSLVLLPWFLATVM